MLAGALPIVSNRLKKKLLNSRFQESFFSEIEFLFFPHCTALFKLELFQEISFNYVYQFQCYGGLSKGDYEKVAPPHSFVHLDDFDTIEELSDHLNHLQTSTEAYK